MLNKLFGKFFSKKQTVNPDSEDANTLILSVENLEPYLKIMISKTDNLSAKIFANMLFDLHKGYFISAITRTLLDIGKNSHNVNVDTFVQNVIVEWKHLCDKDSVSKTVDEPQIKPTYFFQFLRNDNHE